jgi:hypothetical protein
MASSVDEKERLRKERNWRKRINGAMAVKWYLVYRVDDLYLVKA